MHMIQAHPKHENRKTTVCGRELRWAAGIQTSVMVYHSAYKRRERALRSLLAHCGLLENFQDVAKDPEQSLAAPLT